MEPSEIVSHIIERRECIVYGDFTAASGAEANVKIEFDRIPTRSVDYQAIGLAVAMTIRELDLEPDLVITVPTGFNRFASPIARNVLLPVVHFQKMPQPGKRPRINYDAKAILNRSERIILADDVYSTGLSALILASYIGLDRIVSIVPVIDRGRDVNSIETPYEAIAHTKRHPHLPPAHIRVPYPVKPVLSIPLPFRQTQLSLAV